MASTTSAAVAMAAVIACGGAAVAAAAAASSSSSSSLSVVGGGLDSTDPLSSSLLRIASAALASSSSSSIAAAAYYLQGNDIAEAARVAVSVGAGAVLGVSAYVLALASAPLLVSLPREGSGSLRVTAARCASAVVASAASARSSAMVSF